MKAEVNFLSCKLSYNEPDFYINTHPEAVSLILYPFLTVLFILVNPNTYLADYTYVLIVGLAIGYLILLRKKRISLNMIYGHGTIESRFLGFKLRTQKINFSESEFVIKYSGRGRVHLYGVFLKDIKLFYVNSLEFDHLKSYFDSIGITYNLSV